MSSKETKWWFGMIMRKRIEQRLRSMPTSSSWTSSSERIWWLSCLMRRLSSSTLSPLSWSSRLTHSQIQQDSALCLKLKSLSRRLFVYQDKKKVLSRFWTMVSLRFFFIHSFLVVDKSIDLVIPAHDTEIGAMAVNPDGTLIASASKRGHIIKIYSTDGGEVV